MDTRRIQIIIMEERKKLAANWNDRVFRLGMTRQDFANSIDMFPQQFGKYINCRGNAPSQKTIERINKGLKELENG